MGAAAPVAAIGGGLSLASLGMKAGSDVAAGLAKQQEYEVKAENYLLGSTSQATNYRYQGEAQKEQFELQSGQDLMQASGAETAAEFGALRAAMTDASARQGMTNTLGNIAVTRAAGGADLTSPTTAALEGKVYGIENTNREAAVGSINTQTAEEKAAADYLRQASSFALMQGSRASAMGEYNAETALNFGAYNAGAARGAGATAADMGYFNAATDILGGLGKAFGSMAPGGGGGGGGGGDFTGVGSSPY